MRVDIVAVGKVKERYVAEAVEDYSVRLGRYCRLGMSIVQEEPFTESDSCARKDELKALEARKMLARIRPNSRVIACDLAGREMTSEQFAAFIENLGIASVSDLTFLIGGPQGFGPLALARADDRICFSKMTFPHQLMRVFLLEQIYRAFRIIRNEPYHY